MRRIAVPGFLAILFLIGNSSCRKIAANGPTPVRQAAPPPAASAKVPSWQSVDLGYVYEGSTVGPLNVRISGKVVPIQFDTKRSDPMALASFFALNNKVTGPNTDGHHLFLVGDYDVETHALYEAGSKQDHGIPTMCHWFVLRHWYILTPFKAERGSGIDSNADHNDTVTRQSLERSDFNSVKGSVQWMLFDPQNPAFNPRVFQKHVPQKR